MPNPDKRTRAGSQGRARSTSLAEEARRHILEDIIQCRLRPGEMFQLSTLARQHAMSKTPIREALALLQDDGLVESIPYRGYRVTPIDRTDFEEIILLRRLLEGTAAELAAANISEDEIERLASLRPPDTFVMTLDYDNHARDFHYAIAQVTRMRRLSEMVRRTYEDMRRLQYAGIGRPRPEMLTKEHGLILDALRAHDAAGARRAMEEHIDNIRARALED